MVAIDNNSLSQTVLNRAFHKVSSVQQKESSAGKDKLSHEAIAFAELVSYTEANRCGYLIQALPSTRFIQITS